jgi:hypothetical protein
VRLAISLWAPLSLLLMLPLRLMAPWIDRVDVEQRIGPPVIRDVNRPRVPEDCELPLGINWYGSRKRCLAELCANQNVFNEYLFDAGGRRGKNPCYGQSPTQFEGN